MHKFKTEFYLKVIFLIILVTIISAYAIEYIMGYQPCNLCLIERIPYVLGIIILLINYRFKGNEKAFILMLIIIFIFSLIISMYHYGIEQAFFQESAVCDLKSGTDILSKEELLLELQKKPASCMDVTFRIFGFSLTTINMIISLLLIILLTKVFIFYEKNKQ